MILFCAASDTLVKLLEPIYTKLEGVEKAWCTLGFTNERAEYGIAQLNISSKEYIGTLNFKNINRLKPEIILFGNDWGDEVKGLIAYARTRQIRTAVVQESVINFLDNKKRLCHADVAFLQGDVSATLVQRTDIDALKIVGNPRYENYSPSISPKDSFVLINVNFTYGVESKNALAWVEAAVLATKNSGNVPKILRHPRDQTDLENIGCEIIQSNANTIENILKDSSLLITRFSSLIHESIALNRAVIYFNPYKENVFYPFGNNTEIFKNVESTLDLTKEITAIKALTNNTINISFAEYTQKHFRPYSEKPSELIKIELSKLIDEKAIVQTSCFGLVKAVFFFYKAILKEFIRPFK